MRAARAVASATTRRLLRDRTALFFLAVLPIVVIVLVGSAMGGFTRFDVTVVDRSGGEVGRLLIEELEAGDGIAVHREDDVEAARTALRRNETDAVVVLPAGLDDDVGAGRAVEVPVLGERSNTGNQAAIAAIRGAVGAVAGRLQAAGFVAEHVGGELADRLTLVEEVAGGVAGSAVAVDVVDAESDVLPVGFSYSAPTMLVLFVFINALAAGAAVIEARDLGIYARALAAPVRARSVVAGEAASQLLVALGQSVLLVVTGAVVFGVDWGDPLAAAALVAAWALVGTGAGLLSGTVFRTPQQAAAVGAPVGVALGMLGGCMWPLEIVPEPMRVIGHLTPHAWAVNGWTELLSRGGQIGDIAVPLAVLCGVAAVLLVLSSRRLAASLAR